MIKWISILALLLGLTVITLFLVESRNTRDRIQHLESQVSDLQGESDIIREDVDTLLQKVDEIAQSTGELITETGKLVAEKQSVESEMQTLRSNPSTFIDAIGAETTESGFFNIKTRISKVTIRNRSRFNVNEIQINVWFLKDDLTESGVTAQVYVRDILVAGQTKGFEVENAPWMDGRPGVKLKVSQVEVVEK